MKPIEISEITLSYFPKGVSKEWVKRSVQKVRNNKTRTFKKRGCSIQWDERPSVQKAVLTCPPKWTTLPTATWF